MSSWTFFKIVTYSHLGNFEDGWREEQIFPIKDENISLSLRT